MMIQTKYDIGQMVFIKTDTDQKPRMIVGVIVYPGTVIQYDLSPWGKAWELELSDTKDVMMATTNH